MLAEEARNRLCALLKALGLPIYHPALVAEKQGQSALLAGLQEFREHLGGALCVTLLTGIGSGIEVHDMDASLIASSIGWLAAHQG
jgi:3-dehydroquinate synthase